MNILSYGICGQLAATSSFANMRDARWLALPLQLPPLQVPIFLPTESLGDGVKTRKEEQKEEHGIGSHRYKGTTHRSWIQSRQVSLEGAVTLARNKRTGKGAPPFVTCQTGCDANSPSLVARVESQRDTDISAPNPSRVPLLIFEGLAGILLGSEQSSVLLISAIVTQDRGSLMRLAVAQPGKNGRVALPVAWVTQLWRAIHVFFPGLNGT